METCGLYTYADTSSPTYTYMCGAYTCVYAWRCVHLYRERERFEKKVKEACKAKNYVRIENRIQVLVRLMLKDVVLISIMFPKISPSCKI